MKNVHLSKQGLIILGFAAILVATIPIWFVIIDKRQWHTYFSNKYIIGGLFIGFVGILLLFNEVEWTTKTCHRDQRRTHFLIALPLHPEAQVSTERTSLKDYQARAIGLTTIKKCLNQ